MWMIATESVNGMWFARGRGGGYSNLTWVHIYVRWGYLRSNSANTAGLYCRCLPCSVSYLEMCLSHTSMGAVELVSDLSVGKSQKTESDIFGFLSKMWLMSWVNIMNWHILENYVWARRKNLGRLYPLRLPPAHWSLGCAGQWRL